MLTTLARVRLVLAEQRSLGLPFEPAWRTALRELDGDPFHWRGALQATRNSWRRAYLRVLEPGAEAVLMAHNGAEELGDYRAARRAQAAG